MEIYGIIMAGGGGTRFWPLSRKQIPKQLLNLTGRDVMVNETADRLSRVTTKENIYIVTNQSQTGKMKEVTQGKVLPENILSEPASRNTAACIGYAAVKILKEKGDGVMLITPSDAYIADEEAYAKALKTAAEWAKNSSDLVTVGISPTFPATGYGYIRFKKSENEVKTVLSFVEKPDVKRAEQYLKSGEYVWNSGIFVWKASVIMQKFQTYLPDIYADLMKIYQSIGTENESEVLFDVYPEIRSISIDYGVMEKSGGIRVVCGDFGWNDVGSWDMLGVLHKGDKNGNVTVGDTLFLDSKDNVVYSDKRLVAAVGVENLIIVETPDAVLVIPKDRAQDVKKIVEELKARGREELL